MSYQGTENQCGPPVAELLAKAADNVRAAIRSLGVLVASLRHPSGATPGQAITAFGESVHMRNLIEMFSTLAVSLHLPNLTPEQGGQAAAPETPERAIAAAAVDAHRTREVAAALVAALHKCLLAASSAEADHLRAEVARLRFVAESTLAAAEAVAAQLAYFQTTTPTRC